MYYEYDEEFNLWNVYSVNQIESDFLGDELIYTFDTKEECIEAIKEVEQC